MTTGKTKRFDWDRHNVGHIAKHGIRPEEVERVLLNGPRFVRKEWHEESGEERTLEMGHTENCRVLFVVWTMRESLRPVTAWDASSLDRADYYEEKGWQSGEEND